MSKRRGGVVWSSDPEAVPATAKRSPDINLPPEKQTARLGRSRSGRAGKTVITVEGLQLDAAGLHELARVIRQRCGTGGTVRDGVIEVQGDIRDRVAQVLQELGYHTKLVGG